MDLPLYNRCRPVLAAHPHPISPVLQVISRASSTFLIKQAEFNRRDAQTGATTLIQRFGLAARKPDEVHPYSKGGLNTGRCQSGDCV